MNGDDSQRAPAAAKVDLTDGAGSGDAEQLDISSDMQVLTPALEEEGVPLSYMQEQLWFLARLTPNLPIDNLSFFIDTPPSLNVAALTRSLQEIVLRHEALRTTFVFKHGRPVQLIHPSIEVHLPVISIEELPIEEQELEIRRLAEARLQEPFDFERGPLFRAILIRRTDGLHKLIFIVHHTAIDGYSAYNVFFPELVALYKAYSAGEESPLPPVRLQIRHYAAWQRRKMQGGTMVEQMRYWKRQLENLPAALDLPTDRPRPATPSNRAAECSHLLPSALVIAARILGRQEQSSLFTVILAALLVLLHRYTNQEDVFVGTIVADRSSEHKRSILGPLINTVVLRAALRGHMSFRQVIRRVRDVLAEARANSDLPFEMLVNELRPPRSPGQNPLFQIALNYPHAAPSGEWSITHRGAAIGTTNIDLIFEIQSAPEGTYFHAQYSTDLFDGPTIRRMLERLEVLLGGAIRDVDTCLWELPLLTHDEQDQLSQWSQPSAIAPEMALEALGETGAAGDGATFPRLFERQVERSPEQIAVVHGDVELSYRELNVRANRLAHRLRAMHVGPETRVCIFLDRSAEMLVAILAVLKAGGAYVPIDPALPRARVSLLLEDADPLVVLAQRNLLALLPEGAPTLVLDAERSSILEESEQNPEGEIQLESAAYILYTSGSTGKPKGVVIEHRNTASFLSAIAGSFTEEDLACVLGSTSIGFDVSVFELFLPLCQGGTIVLARNVLALAETSTRFRVTLISAVPSAISALLDIRGVPTSVQTVVVAGEALYRELAERILALGHVRKLYNMYGPTECTTYSTGAVVREGEAPMIGRPLANTRVYVLSPGGGQVPVGVPGELYIGGAGVARGYLNRPDLTAERFSPDPFGSGERAYRTGDLVRFRTDGEIDFIGRIDHQVKLRGFRIELGEIESTLLLHPLLREVAVLKVEDVPGDERLVAYAAPEPRAERTLLVEALRKHARSLLPGYMVPTSFVFLEGLPKTTSGKIDRRALLREKREPEIRAAHVEPKGEMELLIADIWRRVLRVDDVSVLDNFFDLGGNSLLLVRVHEALRRSINEPITMLQLFASPTIRALAQVLSSESTQDVPSTRMQDRARKHRLALGEQRQRLVVKRGKP